MREASKGARQRAAGKFGSSAETEGVTLLDAGDHFTFLFVLFIALLTGEWLLRRRWHLR